MPRNGRRAPARPSIELIAPNADPLEAAAIAAAIEQFLRDTAPPAPSDLPGSSGWARASLLEGIGASEGAAPWGGGDGWLGAGG